MVPDLNASYYRYSGSSRVCHYCLTHKLYLNEVSQRLYTKTKHYTSTSKYIISLCVGRAK